MNAESRKNLFEQLKIDEGISNEIYMDHLDYPTVGVGHFIVPEDEDLWRQPPGFTISDERVWELFDNDLDTCISECQVMFPDGEWARFPAEVQEIIANMMFNMGRTRLSKFKNMIAALQEGDWARAAVEGRDSLWYRQVTNRAERLMVRLENVS